MAKRTENYDQGGCCHAGARSVGATVRTADALNIRVHRCVVQRRCNVALLVSHRFSHENIWRIGRTRSIDFGVAVVGPRNFVDCVADTSHVGIFVHTANDQSVIRPRCDCAQRACSHHTVSVIPRNSAHYTAYRRPPWKCRSGQISDRLAGYKSVNLGQVHWNIFSQIKNARETY